MYNPLAYVGFGNADSISIVAIEDFEIIDRLASGSDLPVIQTTLAFCPTLVSLRESMGVGDMSFLVEMDEVCDGRPPTNTDSGAPGEFAEKGPLLGVTYYKVSGMANLGPGLLFQQAIYKAMVRRMEWVLKELLKREAAGQYEGVMSDTDIRSFRCALLDPQGSSDLGTLMFARNYSVIASVLQALRTLTFWDLYAQDRLEHREDRLRNAAELFGIHKAVADVENRRREKEACRRQEKAKAASSLERNHVFCSTFTTLGMSQEAFLCDDRGKAKRFYSGIVVGSPHFVVSAGHERSMTGLPFFERDRGADADDTGKLTDTAPAKYHWYLVGLYDAVHRTLAGLPHASETAEVFEFVELIKEMRGCRVAEEFGGRAEWPIQDLCTELHVPCPLLDENDYVRALEGVEDDRPPAGSHFDLRPILSEMGKCLLQERSGDLSIVKLRESIRRLRLPSPLSSAIFYLYADFAKSLADAYVFDQVLDLYDIFRAVHGLFCRELPKSLEARLKRAGGDSVLREWACLSMLTTSDIREITDLIELIENSLEHRTRIGFREIERWQPAIDYKGGLNKLIHAADAPMLCGLGLLKRVESIHSQRDRSAPKDAGPVVGLEEIAAKIGGATEVSYNARAGSRRYDIAGGDVSLASLSINQGHLTRPSTLTAHFHEAGHLIFDLVRSSQKEQAEHCDVSCPACGYYEISESTLLSSGAVERKERYEEIFSEMLVYRFIFEDPSHRLSYLRHYMTNYFADPISFCASSENSLCRLIEVLIRGFLVTYPLEKPEKQPSMVGPLFEDPHHEYEPTDQDVREARNDFENVLERVGPPFFEYRRLWDGPKAKGTAWEYASRQFERVFRESYRPVSCIWARIEEIHTAICLEGVGEGALPTDPPKEIEQDLLRQMKDGYGNGQPIIRMLCEVPNRATDDDGRDNAEERERLDCSFLVRRLLRLHIEKMCGGDGMDSAKLSHVFRDPAGGLPSRPAGKTPFGASGWNTCLLDRSQNGLVSGDLRRRRESLLRRVTVIKTLWDVSTNLRARRLKRILTDTQGVLFEAK